MSQWVAYPVQTPHHCGFSGISGHQPEGYIEGIELFGGDRPYMAVAELKRWAERLGYVPRAAIDSSYERNVARLEKENGELRERNAVLEQHLDAIATLRKNDAWQAKRASGRPPSKQKVGV